VWKKPSAPSNAWGAGKPASEASSKHEAGAKPKDDVHPWNEPDDYPNFSTTPRSSKSPPVGAEILVRDKCLRRRAYERGECTKKERDATIVSQFGLKPTPTPDQEVTARDRAWIKILRCIRTTRIAPWCTWID
jgi:hypothetical protein